MVIGVDHAHAMLLIIGIEDLQHILANELIVSVQVDHDGVLTAMVPHSDVYIFQCGPAFSIVKIDVFMSADVVKEEVVADELVTAVV